MKKRGLSTVVTSLIIILLVLVAVGIVWIVVKNIISEGAEQVALGKLTMNLEVKSVEVNDGSVDVQVKRNSGAGELSGIKFIIDDGINTQVFDEATTIAELGTQSFNLAYSGLVKEVSIAGIFETESGKEFTGNEINKFEFSNEEVIKNINGLISWWRFEGDATDEVGDNDGTINGADCSVEGKYGRACEFDGVDDYVDVGNESNLDISGTITLEAWINTKEDAWQGIVGKGNGTGFGAYPYQLKYSPGITGDGVGGIQFLLVNDSGGVFLCNIYGNYDKILVNKWHHVVRVYDGTKCAIYIDGNLDYEGASISGSIFKSSKKVSIAKEEHGIQYTFNGTIDEVMIFNKALSEEEVRALYALKLA